MLCERYWCVSEGRSPRPCKYSASVCDARFVVDLHNADLLHIYYIVFFFFFLGTIFYT